MFDVPRRSTGGPVCTRGMQAALFTGALVLAVVCGPVFAGAESRPGRARIWDIAPGASLSELPPASAFKSLACGSNGGPPGMALKGWSQYGECAPDIDGRHEIYLEYDDEAEYRALASGTWIDPAQIGTSEFFFPVIVSALIDAGGTVDGIRIVTDPRPSKEQRPGVMTTRPRGEHYLMAGYLMARFGMTDTDCTDLPPATGETAVIGQFVKRSCEKTAGDTRIRIEQHYLRKPGQTDIDPVSRQLTEGQYESWTRAEIRRVQRSE